MDKSGLTRSGRAVGPNLVGWIEFGSEHKAVFTAEALQLVRILGAVEPAVDGDDGILLQHL